MKTNVVQMPHAAAPAPERSDEQIIARFRAWWPKAPARVKSGIRKIVAEEVARAHDAEAREVLDHLNSKRPGKRGYRPVEANLKLIRARLADGITVQQLRAIVTVKARQCESDEFQEQFLRPITLFNATKCEQYLGELGQ